MEANQRLQYLFEQQLRHENSAEEKAALLVLMADRANEEQVKLLMSTWWEEFEPMDGSPEEARGFEKVSGSEPVFQPGQGEEILERLLQEHVYPTQQRDKKVKLWPGIAGTLRRVEARRLWLASAAAVAAITLGVWLYYASNLNARHPELVSGSPLANDIAPGKNTATLMLANGEVIQLSDAKTGVVIDASKLSYVDGEELSISSESGSRRGDPEASSETTQFSGSRTMSVSTPRGGQYQVVLPDGTKVWLNADSKLEFPSQFIGRERKVLLVSGEAYFEVSHNNAKPFIVETAGAAGRPGQRVTVLGTHFNINSYADEGPTKTTLLEGSVSISSLRDLSPSLREGTTTRAFGESSAANQSHLDSENEIASSRRAPRNDVVLKPNQQAVLTANNTIQVKEVDPASAIDWKNGEFIFNKEPLESIMRKVARWYNVEVVYEDETLKTATFSGSVSRYDKVSKLLRQLDLTDQVHFKIEGRRITVIK